MTAAAIRLPAIAGHLSGLLARVANAFRVVGDIVTEAGAMIDTAYRRYPTVV